MFSWHKKGKYLSWDKLTSVIDVLLRVRLLKDDMFLSDMTAISVILVLVRISDSRLGNDCKRDSPESEIEVCCRSRYRRLGALCKVTSALSSINVSFRYSLESLCIRCNLSRP